MRLVAWNCRSGIHRKLEALHALAPDVAIIPECCNLEILARKAPGLAPTSALWIGANPNKGLGVFSFGPHHLERDDAYDPSISYALPVRVSGLGPDRTGERFHLVALWAHHGVVGTRMSTTGPTLQALAAYESFLLARPSIVAGDFNNHVRWDKVGKAWNHANTVAAFERLGFVSAYHEFLGLEQGAEQHPTFYWRTRSADGPTYHIDYVFVPRASVGRLQSVAVGSRADWIATGLSDHVPLILDFDPAFAADV
ncbi:MAG TPA: endonuclease/exonuclease/phosphatase family protein [Chloroflexota bacterium]|nr:endonuclease/exonuclease/phosphatase family protein [Chloroflexota bacterium]